MSISSRRKWASSERISIKVLEEMGFKVIAIRHPIVIEGVEIGEADLIAEDESGKRYCVEIKAGKIDVSGLRQVYVNSKILNMKPMVICKGFANRAAEKLANELGVKVLKLSDQFLVESEELEIIVREALEDVIGKYLELLLTPTYRLRPEYYDFVKAIIQASNIEDVAKRLDWSINDVARMLGKLRNNNVLPKWANSFKSIKLALTLLYYKMFIDERLNRLDEIIEKLSKTII